MKGKTFEMGKGGFFDAYEDYIKSCEEINSKYHSKRIEILRGSVDMISKKLEEAMMYIPSKHLKAKSKISVIKYRRNERINNK